MRMDAITKLWRTIESCQLYLYQGQENIHKMTDYRREPLEHIKVQSMSKGNNFGHEKKVLWVALNILLKMQRY